jgi:hypothetical protein
MDNWRTVNITGTMTEEDATALREYLGYSYDRDDPAMERFGPLSFSREKPSLCGLNRWPAAKVSAIGNIAERDYSPRDVARHLRKLVTIAPSMNLVIHCGGDWESARCIATIRVANGLVVMMKQPEVAQIDGISDEQATMNVIRAISGGYDGSS